MRTSGFKSADRRFLDYRTTLAWGVLLLAACGSDEGPIDPDSLPIVVARVNQHEVQRSELVSRSRSIQQLADAHGQIGSRTFYQDILDELITSELLFQEAGRLDLVPDEQEISNRVAVIRDRFDSEEQFLQTLASQQLTPSRMAQALRKDLAIKNLVERELAPRIALDEDQVKEYFSRNPNSFKRPEQVHASHILLQAGAQASAAQKEEARLRLLGLRRRIEAGEDFSQLAREHSQDPETAPDGGDLKWIGRGQIVPELEKVLFELPVGTLSQPIETSWGLHLVLVREKRAEKNLTYEEARPAAYRFLRELELQRLTAELAGKLRQEANIEIFI